VTTTPQNQLQTLQRRWHVCRDGVERCLSNEGDRQVVLDWLRTHLQSGHDPLFLVWVDVLQGKRPELVHELRTQPVYPGTGQWRRLVSSNPFVALVVTE